MKRALIVLGLGAATLLSASACSDKDPGTMAVPGGPGGPGGGAPSGTEDGGAVPGGPGGPGATPGSTGGIPGGGIVLPPTGTDYIMDATGSSGLDQATIDGLKAGGASCTTDVLYPYEGTVFPGALISPPIMWQGGADAAYVRVKYESLPNLDFEYAVGPTNPGELRIPQEHWNEITRRTQNTPLLVTFTTKSGNTLSTCQLKYRVAAGNMVGSIYYNTYNHPDAGGVGAVLRLRLGSPSAELYLREPVGVPPVGPCISCHSVSASGSVIAASSHIYFPASFSAKSYRITDAVQPPMLGDVKDAAFGALTPSGDAILRMGQPECTQGSNAFPRAKNNFPLQLGPEHASLIDTATGAVLQTTGLRPDRYMWMPQFSPDGRKLVFNDAKPDGAGGTDRRELAVMDYDAQTRTFSNPRTIVSRAMLNAQGVVNPTLDYAPLPVASAQAGNLLTPVPGTNGCFGAGGPGATGNIPGGTCTGPCYPAWPFFTPDGRGVIFSLVSEPDFAVAFPGRDKASLSELWYANLDSGQLFRLDNANKGLEPTDSLANYYPTVLPVQVGGYFWLFWTSTRDFGHKDLNAPPEWLASDIIFGSASVSEGFRKRIWVTAIRAPAQTGELLQGIDSDPSFPGFYLEGQGETGNTRAFAALNPCQESGTECTSGLDCCTGFCNITPGASTGMCGEKIECAKTNEKCSVDSDCCPPESAGAPPNTCIGGYCGFTAPLL